MNPIYDYTNGTAISVIVKKEIKRFIEEYCNKHSNDASLGEAIRRIKTFNEKNDE